MINFQAESCEVDRLNLHTALAEARNKWIGYKIDGPRADEMILLLALLDEPPAIREKHIRFRFKEGTFESVFFWVAVDTRSHVGVPV